MEINPAPGLESKTRGHCRHPPEAVQPAGKKGSCRRAYRSKKYGLDKPFIKLILDFGKNEEKETLLIGKKATGQRFYALKAGGKIIFELHPSTIDSLNNLRK